MLRALVFISFLFPGLNLFGQDINLVPNGGFEEYSKCPGNYSRRVHEFWALQWSSPSVLGTPDHFHVCSAGDADVPYNWAGVSDAYEGDGYAGIYLWDARGYREYLQVALKEPLKKDSLYHLRFRYKLSSYSKYSTDRIGLLLTDSALSVRHSNTISMTPTLSVVQDSALTKQTGLWEEATRDYIARGDERYLAIGNFFDNGDTRTYKIIFRDIQQEMLASAAYYYIDDVNVIPAYRVEEIPVLIPGFTLEADANTTYLLKNVRFEFDSYKLRSSSFPELDNVVKYMQTHPKVTVQLLGHTDDVGSENYNQRLSRNRAQSVAHYLKTQGIAAGRIDVFGYGKSRPLISEVTPFARRVNRRVEIRFVK